jgi:hypothetical protein
MIKSPSPNPFDFKCTSGQLENPFARRRLLVIVFATALRAAVAIDIWKCNVATVRHVGCSRLEQSPEPRSRQTLTASELALVITANGMNTCLPAYSGSHEWPLPVDGYWHLRH